MKERPILFSSPMVRAIREGRKTMTRRVVKPQSSVLMLHGQILIEGWLPEFRCPYGQPGDILWVRENGWERPDRTSRMMREGADTWEPYYYDADGLTEADVYDFKRWGFKRRPSIHMPRWASRITLEIVSVRVERVRDITEEDAKAEGVDGDGPVGNIQVWQDMGRHRYQMARLWDSINSKRGFGWEANPYAWVLGFRRVEK